ncbi:3'-5' exonuclease [Amycolatopsis sp. WGS_07]|uniref:3'-5' exonuclease n=1 Tax=Amycolatopsis sp. WGS_07 TaxID=3076764 RepID=UPI003872AFC4
MPDTTDAPWTTADLVAIDLEGSGPQDPAGEAILEIALVPIRSGAPDIDNAYTTVINPERPIRRGPWISPGLTSSVLAAAPPLASVAPEIAERVAGRVLVGHNVGVDWRLLRKRVPDARPAGLLDTLRLAKAHRPDLKKGHSLSDWIKRLDLTDTITAAAPGSQPHRALWDTVAAGQLLAALATDTPDTQPSLAVLLAAGGIPLGDAPAPKPDDQQTLWDSL